MVGGIAIVSDPTVVHVPPSIETSPVKVFPDRVRRTKYGAFASGPAVWMERPPLVGADEHEGVPRVRGERLAHHDAGFRPVVHPLDARHLRDNRSVAGERPVNVAEGIGG